MLNSMKRLFVDLNVAETEETSMSRRLLQAHCHETFEPGNSRLIEAMGWKTDAFVPDVSCRSGGRTDLDALDGLWESRASGVELEALYSALEHAISSESKVTQAERTFGKASGRAERRKEAAQRRMEKAERRCDELKAELAAVRSSWSFKLSDSANRLIVARARAGARALRASCGRATRKQP
jgi:hypothetical protein